MSNNSSSKSSNQSKLVAVKVRRDVWDEFSRMHRIEDGRLATKKQPPIPLCDALSEFILKHLNNKKKPDAE